MKPTIINDDQPAIVREQQISNAAIVTKKQAPDFNQVRRYMSTDNQRTKLDEFITDGWSPTELAEYARDWRLYGGTRPTASAYQIVVERGAAHPFALATLNWMRSPNYVVPPFDRCDDDDPNNPEHSAELKADIEVLARCVMSRNDERSWRRKKRGPDAPISRKLWKECFRDLQTFKGLELTIDALRLRPYVHQPLAGTTPS